MARFNIQLESGATAGDIADLLEAYDAEVVNDDSEGNITVDVPEYTSEDAAAFSYDAEKDFNVNCIDEVK